MKQTDQFTINESVIKLASTDPELKLRIINQEYKLFSVYAHKLQMIAVPKLQQDKEWHCLLSIQYGLYSPGKIKFILNFGRNFPLTIPTIKLVTKLTHPLIDEQGNVDLRTLIPNWKYGKDHMLYNLLSAFHDIFIDISFLECQDSFNPQAAILYKKDVDKFGDQIKKEISQHNDLLYVDADQFDLKFTKPTDSTYEFMEMARQINNDPKLSFQEKKQEILKYIRTKSSKQ